MTAIKTELKHMQAVHSDKSDVLGMASAKLETLIEGNGYSAGKVGALSKSLAKRGKAYDADIHAAAVAAIYISMPLADGGTLNGEPARQLIASIGKSSRAMTLKDWFAAFSNIRLTLKDGAWTVKMLGPDKEGYKPAQPVKAFDKPFWSVEEQTRGAQAFDFAGAMARLLARAANDEKLSEDDKSKAALLKTWAVKHKLVDIEGKALKAA